MITRYLIYNTVCSYFQIIPFHIMAEKKSIFDMCKQDVSWFKAAAQGDLSVIVDQMAKKT